MLRRKKTNTKVLGKSDTKELDKKLVLKQLGVVIQQKEKELNEKESSLLGMEKTLQHTSDLLEKSVADLEKKTQASLQINQEVGILKVKKYLF